jgi:hypothetical protein
MLSSFEALKVSRNMKLKLVIGQKIVAVQQSRVKTNSGTHWSIDRIVLANGATMIPTAYECENEGPVGDLILVKRKHPNDRVNSSSKT